MVLTKANIRNYLKSAGTLPQGAVIGIDDEDDSTFTITVDQKTFHFQGKSYIYWCNLLHTLLRKQCTHGHVDCHSSGWNIFCYS